MKKIVGYIAVLMVFSWVTTANATIVETITNSNGVLSISGFGDATPQTFDFAFTFTDPNSGTAQVFAPGLVSGQTYAVNANFNIDALALLNPPANNNPNFSVDFLQLSLSNQAPTNPHTVNELLTAFDGTSSSGALGSIGVNVNGKQVNLNLTSVSILAGVLTLGTTETDANLNFSKYLNFLDGQLTGVKDVKVTITFSNANLTVNTVPEPVTLLLLGSGLLGMLGFSKKRV